MSDAFQNNYKSASNIVKNINSILATIKENNNPNEVQKQLSRVKQYFEQAKEALSIMKNAASRMNYNSKIQAMGSVRDIEQSVASVKKEISRLEAKVNKTALVGADAEERKKKMAEGLIQMQEVKATAYESESIGHGALESLSSQREVLVRSNDKVEEVKNESNRARQILKDMNKKIVCNKVFVTIIIVLLILAILVMIYLIFEKKRRS